MARPAAIQANGNIVELRKLLTQRFPHLRFGWPIRSKLESIPTGISSLDNLLGGGLPRSELTELIARGNGSGSAEIIHALLDNTAINRQFLALIDGMGSFDVNAVDPEVLPRLFWVRCNKTSDALLATDLILRDRNFPLLVLDLKLNPTRELRKISSSTWFRYDRLLEQNSAAVLIITPQQIVSAASCRITVESSLGIEFLEQSRTELLANLRFAQIRALTESSEEPTARAI